MGTYSEWDEEKKLEFLVTELQGKRPLVFPTIKVSSDAREVLDTFRVVVEFGSESLGAYVILVSKANNILVVERLSDEPLFMVLAQNVQDYVEQMQEVYEAMRKLAEGKTKTNVVAFEVDLNGDMEDDYNSKDANVEPKPSEAFRGPPTFIVTSKFVLEKLVRRDVVNSDLRWRRLIRSVCEQYLAK